MSRTVPVFLLLALLWARPALAGDPVRLSAGLDQIEAALKAKDATFPLALVVDKPALAPTETLRLLELIETLAKKGSAVVAVCPKLAKPAAGGSAAVALSCSGVLFVEGASVSGAEPGWCLNPATIDQIKAKCAKLGGIDLLLAERLCKADAALHWSSESGFSTTPSKVEIAKAGAPIAIDAALLDSLGIGAESFPALDDAVAAVQGGSVVPRVNPSVEGSKKTAPRPQAPTGPTIEARLAPKLAEYATTLRELQELLKYFEEYWTGREGEWTTMHKNLRAVWIAGSDHTADGVTRTDCQRLQKLVGERVAKLGKLRADIARIAKDKQHPEVRRTEAQREAFEGIKDAMRENEADLYDKWSPVIRGFK
ncbi:MAG: hypothetical protein RL325_1977 [Planctomycetota bacterium]|jgi:hypothetical protein